MNKPLDREIALFADDLHFSYRQKNRAQPELSILRGVSLALHRGESVAIVGASGSGKSTLLHLLGGLDTPDKGSVTLLNAPLSSAPDKKRTRLRNRHLGFVYQFHHLLAEFTAQENVAMPLKIRGITPKEAMQQAGELLDQVGLSERKTHKPGELSGGERQRTAIARALVHKPDILLADEPTGNLDQDNAQAVFSLMMTLVREQQGAMMIVTHDMSLARQMDRCLYLHHGTLQETRPTT